MNFLGNWPTNVGKTSQNMLVRAFSRVCNVPRKPLVSHPMGHLQLSTRRQDGRHCIFGPPRAVVRPWHTRGARATAPGDPGKAGQPPLATQESGEDHRWWSRNMNPLIRAHASPYGRSVAARWESQSMTKPLAKMATEG